MQTATVINPIQVFTVSEIRENVTVLDLAKVKCIRLSASAEYTLGGNTATMPVGPTAFSTNIASITFTTPQTVEIMK